MTLLFQLVEKVVTDDIREISVVVLFYLIVDSLQPTNFRPVFRGYDIISEASNLALQLSLHDYILL